MTDDDDFDAKLVAAAFASAADKGWHRVSAAQAARDAGLDLAHARLRFPTRRSILKRFGQMADTYALEGAPAEAAADTVKDRLFDLMMRRIDFLQNHRGGVIALARLAPLEPGLSAWLACATLDSMGWLLEGAGVSAQGIPGALRKRGLAAVWVWGLRAWLRDESADLAATMAAVDAALSKADGIAARFTPPGAAPGAVPGRKPQAAGIAPDADTIAPPRFPDPGAPPAAAPGI